MKIPKHAYTTEFKELAVKRVKAGQSISTVITRVRQLITQAFDFIRCRFKQCHYSKVSCSGRLGFARFKAAKTWVCSLLVVDRPALGWVPFRVMR